MRNVDDHWFADPEQLGLDPSKIEALLVRVRRDTDSGLLPAAQVAIARHGKLAVYESFGDANAELALFYQGLLHGGPLRGGGGRPHDDSEIWRDTTLANARRVRTGELQNPDIGKAASRGLGIVVAGDAFRNFRGFGKTNSAETFGHSGAGGQLAWADPVTGLSLGYCTNGHDRNLVRRGRRGTAISSLAAVCLA